MSIFFHFLIPENNTSLSPFQFIHLSHLNNLAAGNGICIFKIINSSKKKPCYIWFTLYYVSCTMYLEFSPSSSPLQKKSWYIF